MQAILSYDSREYADHAFQWLEKRVPLSDVLPDCYLNGSVDCRVTDTVNTARDAIYVMNALYDDDRDATGSR